MMGFIKIEQPKVPTRRCLVCERLEIDDGMAVDGFAWLCDECKAALKSLVEKKAEQ